MFILKKGHQPGVYVPLRALFLVKKACSQVSDRCPLGYLFYYVREARWPSGRASDSEARGRGSILTEVAFFCP